MKLAESIVEELWFSETSDDEADAQASASLAARLAQSEGLKTFPAVAQKVLGFFYSDDYRVTQVTRALEEDPSLAAGVLRMANSAFFAPSSPITDLNQAFVRIGAKHVKEIVCALATMHLFRSVTPFGAFVRDHCAAVAGLAQFLGREFLPSDNEGLFLGGLLHDMGKMMLLDSVEMDYPDNPDQLHRPDALHILERERLGYDHAVLGAHVVLGWRFGEEVSRIIAWHHQPSRAFEDPQIGPKVAVLRIADRAEYALRHGDETFTAVVDALGVHAECVIAGIRVADLERQWSELYRIRGESLATFGTT